MQKLVFILSLILFSLPMAEVKAEGGSNEQSLDGGVSSWGSQSGSQGGENFSEQVNRGRMLEAAYGADAPESKTTGQADRAQLDKVSGYIRDMEDRTEITENQTQRLLDTYTNPKIVEALRARQIELEKQSLEFRARSEAARKARQNISNNNTNRLAPAEADLKNGKYFNALNKLSLLSGQSDLTTEEKLILDTYFDEQGLLLSKESQYQWPNQFKLKTDPMSVTGGSIRHLINVNTMFKARYGRDSNTPRPLVDLADENQLALLVSDSIIGQGHVDIGEEILFAVTESTAFLMGLGKGGAKFALSAVEAIAFSDEIMGSVVYGIYQLTQLDKEGFRQLGTKISEFLDNKWDEFAAADSFKRGEMVAETALEFGTLLLTGGAAAIKGAEKLTRLTIYTAKAAEDLGAEAVQKFAKGINRLDSISPQLSFQVAGMETRVGSKVAETFLEVSDEGVTGLQSAARTSDLKNVIRMRPGSNGKVAVIGRNMEEVVKPQAKQLSVRGRNVEIFSEDRISKAAKDGWRDLKADHSPHLIPDEKVRNSLMYRENQAWIKKIREEGYTIVDMGNPKGQTASIFYDMELDELADLFKKGAP